MDNSKEKIEESKRECSSKSSSFFGRGIGHGSALIGTRWGLVSRHSWAGPETLEQLSPEFSRPSVWTRRDTLDSCVPSGHFHPAIQLRLIVTLNRLP